MKLLATSFITPLAFVLGLLALIILPVLPSIVAYVWNAIRSGYFMLPLILSAFLMPVWQGIIRLGMLNPLITSVTMVQNLFAMVSLSALIIVQSLAGTDFAFAAAIIIPVFLLLIVRGQESNAWDTEVKFWTRTQALFSSCPKLGRYSSSEVIDEVEKWSLEMKKTIVLTKEEEEAQKALEILQTKINHWQLHSLEYRTAAVQLFNKNMKAHTNTSFIDESIALIKSYIHKIVCNIAVSYSGDKLGALLGFNGKTMPQKDQDSHAEPLFFVNNRDNWYPNNRDNWYPNPVFKGNLIALRVDSTFIPIMVHNFEMVSGGLLSMTYTPFGKALNDRYTVYIERMKDIDENLRWIAMESTMCFERNPRILMDAFYIATNEALHKVEYYKEELDGPETF